MEKQKETKKQKVKTWRIIRRYQSEFSCQEAVRRLIQVHKVFREE
ncbi:hypothetical protein VSQ48_21075 [Candidatus Ventrimonas sp. KK005]